jgi:hypothetical protein
MLIVEVVCGALAVALVVVMALCGVTGLPGILGAVRFVRCTRCDHMGITSATAPVRSCVHCRLGWLLHPMVQLHHAHDVPPRGTRSVSGSSGRP